MRQQEADERARQNAIDAIHAGKVRKPVYCAHPFRKRGNVDGFGYPKEICGACGEMWGYRDEPPRIEIGYLEAE